MCTAHTYICIRVYWSDHIFIIFDCGICLLRSFHMQILNSFFPLLAWLSSGFEPIVCSPIDKLSPIQMVASGLAASEFVLSTGLRGDRKNDGVNAIAGSTVASVTGFAMAPSHSAAAGKHGWSSQADIKYARKLQIHSWPKKCIIVIFSILLFWILVIPFVICLRSLPFSRPFFYLSLLKVCGIVVAFCHDQFDGSRENEWKKRQRLL